MSAERRKFREVEFVNVEGIDCKEFRVRVRVVTYSKREVELVFPIRYWRFGLMVREVAKLWKRARASRLSEIEEINRTLPEVQE